MSAAVLNHSATDFQFEDLFLSSSPAQGFWNAPDSAAAEIQAESFGTTQEDIGEEQDYSSDEEEVEKKGKVEGEAPAPVPGPSAPVSSIAITIQVNSDSVVSEAPTIETVKIMKNVASDSFTKLVLVGKGGFGSVHQVVHKSTNEIFAMKSLKKRHLIKTNSVRDTMTEKDVLRKIRHPFVVRLHYAFQSTSKLYLIMDFVNGGHLLHHMHKETLFSEAQGKFYISQVILALEHLHSLNIIHRDLKPENVLLDASGHVVLTDFGFAKENVTTGESCSSFCGTLEYMAPEVVKKNKYGKAADWWSVGILLYDMLTGAPPFQHENDAVLVKRIVSGHLPMPKFLTNDAQSLLKGLLQRDIKKRFKVGTIKGHPFFKGMNWKKMLNKEVSPPMIPITKKGTYDTSNFDAKFTKTKLTGSAPDSPLSSSLQLQFQGFSYARSPGSPLRG
jgi:serine/threonine protein kinase